MNDAEWQIPASTLNWLSKKTDSSSAVMLLRHSVRDDLPPDDSAYSLPITEIGESLAKQLGAVMGDRLRSLYASPLVRCVQTAEALRKGADARFPIVEDRLLGDPGAFVIDGKRAWSNWAKLGHEGVMDHLASEDFPLPGMADPDPAARLLVSHMLAVADGRPGLHVFVTHDSLVTATAARLLGRPLGRDTWPRYLEGVFFWYDAGQLITAYRDQFRSCQASELMPLDERRVIDFGRREVANALGTDIGVRFSLAGGAFKTLLTGHPPRDLDLWASSVSDREMLVSLLVERGAQLVEKRPYSDAFEIGDRVVELSHKVQSLEEAMAGFDIGLSAIGIEHRYGSDFQALIHPLALESVYRRQVLLIKPLANWKHALATLERVRRYANELGYVNPHYEEDEIWRVFDAQSDDMKRGMLRRFERSTKGGQGILEEVLCRLP